MKFIRKIKEWEQCSWSFIAWDCFSTRYWSYAKIAINLWKFTLFSLKLVFGPSDWPVWFKYVAGLDIWLLHIFIFKINLPLFFKK